MSYSPEYFLARESWRDWRIEAQELIRLGRVERDMRVLDIGCGGGGLLRMARERRADVVGVDTLNVALNLARTRVENNAGEQSRRGAEEKSPLLPRSPAPLLSLIQIGYDNLLPFHSNSFDTILGQHVIEHIPDTAAVLREWHRILKPGGRLALATPNARYPDPAHYFDPDHTHIFSSQELRDALSRAGFVIEHCDAIFPRLWHPFGVFPLAGVVAYNLFRRVQYFVERGRTIIIAGRKT